uniref:Uncharacterized protein n=1 Tax=Rhodosorus marinus TaxID=101924 RepID=A0A7S2ZT19_9RHOD|mmetsp:Transcript_30697/g.117465  ORF Transcript_30697/g.117465 Transcript_30697/m.117465 type:complete len:249 (+) Transcript_30697:324-1070(+)
MQSETIDVKGNQDLELPLIWVSVGNGEVPVVSGEIDNGWVTVVPSGLEARPSRRAGGSSSNGGSSSSSSWEATAFDDRFHMYGAWTQDKTVAESLLKLDQGRDLDRCGLIVYYDKKNWVWGGLIIANGKTLKATAERVDGRFDLAFHGEASRGRGSVRIFFLGDSVAVEFGQSRETTSMGLDITSMYSNMKDTFAQSYDLNRLAHVEPAELNGQAFIGFCTSDQKDTTMNPAFKYLKMRPCNSYTHHS